MLGSLTRRRRIVTIVGITFTASLLLFLTGILAYPIQAPPSNHLATGTKLVYELKSNGNSQTAQGIFQVDFFGNFSEVLSSGANGYYNTLALTQTECKVSSERTFLHISIQYTDRATTVTNDTLTFQNGNAICGNEIRLPTSDGHWDSINGSYLSSFRSLNYSRMIQFNNTSGGASGSSGQAYGEWPFWLSRDDLGSRQTLLLYGLNDQVITNIGVNRTATVLPVNLTTPAASMFSIPSITIDPGDQIFVDRMVLPVAVIFHRVSTSAADTMTSTILRYDTQFGQVAHYAFAPTARYSNGEIFENSDSVWANLILSYKSWKWVPDFLSLSGPAALGNGTTWQNSTEVYSGLVYNHTGYATFGFEGLNASFYRTNGLLLYVSGGSGGDLYSILPAVIVRAFGIAYATSHGEQTTLALQSWRE